MKFLETRWNGISPVLQRGRHTKIALRVQRSESFHGPIKLSLEGFSSGREKDRSPRRISRNLETAAVSLDPGQEIAVLEIRALATCELGTRAVVVRAEATVGGHTVVEYSAPIQVTVREYTSK